MNTSNNKILITGGASGIGFGLTERFLKENNTLIICGRRAEALADVVRKHPGVIVRICDLSKEDERLSLYNWIRDEHSDLNVLINNAGIQNWMSVGDAAFYSRSATEIEINIMAPLHLCALFQQLPTLRTIINVTSGLSFVPLSKVPVYCATKAFLHSFTWSLRHMVKDKGIEVIEMIPPALNTDLGGKGLHDGQPSVKDFVDAVFVQLQAGSQELTFGFSESMAKAGPLALKETYHRMNP